MKGLYVILLMILAISAGCKNDSGSTSADSASSSTNFLAGEGERTWKSTKETNSQGDKQGLDREEKKEYLTFFTNGNFTMGDEVQSQQGTWKQEGSTLVLQFTGQGVSESFTILELDKNTLKVRAADGSEMTMKPE